jgi:TPP-dependent 2-oxoacid decarboxylase
VDRAAAAVVVATAEVQAVAAVIVAINRVISRVIARRKPVKVSATTAINLAI